QAGTHDLARAVDQPRVTHVVLENVRILHVADRAPDALHVGGNALVALATEPGGPGDRGVGAELRFPRGAHLRKIVGEGERRARAVGAMHHADRHTRQIEPRVELLDRRIVPAGDLAHEDIGDQWAAEDELAGLDSGNVVDDVLTGDGRGELDEVELPQDRRRERLVAGAEGDGAGLDLGNAAAGA